MMLAMKSHRVYLIVRDEPDGTLSHFYRIGLGVFWECGPNETEAMHFTTRQAASAMLRQATGLSLPAFRSVGWRILRAKA